MKIKFKQYLGDTGRLPTNENHFNFLWDEPGTRVLFSVSRQGNAASCHFSSNKEGMKKIKQAIREFCEFVFWLFDWCDVVIAKVEMKKVKAIIKKCGFIKVLGSNTNKAIYALRRVM